MNFSKEGNSMDFDKLKQWLELTQKYQSSDFWGSMLDQSSFNQFLKDNMGTSSPSKPSPPSPPETDSIYPSIDIYITDSEVILLAELAGYRKEDLHISVSGNKLLLKGTSIPIAVGQPVLQERKQGPFQRLIELPEPTESGQIKAKFQNGLLTLTYIRRYFPEERVIIE